MSASILRRLVPLVRQQANLEFMGTMGRDGQITETTDLFGELIFDELDFIELAIAVEEVFEMAIADEEWDANRIKTVGDVVKLLEAKGVPA